MSEPDDSETTSFFFVALLARVCIFFCIIENWCEKDQLTDSYRDIPNRTVQFGVFREFEFMVQRVSPRTI